MAITTSERGLSRRALLGGATLAAAAVAGVSGCRSSSTDTGGAKASSQLQLPTYKAFGGVKPELPGNSEGLQPGFTTMPSSFAASTSSKPLTASTLALTETFATPSPAMKNNPYWQRLNAKLGGDLDLIIAQDIGGGYPEKFATILASNDLPDMMWIPPNQGLPNVGHRGQVHRPDRSPVG